MRHFPCFTQILATLPESRDLANSMRLLRSICKVGRSLLPSIQRLVAVTVLVGVDTAAAAAAGRAAGGGSAFNSTNAVGGRDGGEETAGNGDENGRGDGAGGEEGLLRNSRGLFRYELIRDPDDGGSDSSATAATATTAAGAASATDATAEAGAAESGHDSSSGGGGGGCGGGSRRQRSSLSRGGGTSGGCTAVRSADGTRGIRVRLKRLIEGPSLGGQLRRKLELLHGETPVSSGEGVLFEAVQEGYGSASRTVVRVLSRCKMYF